MVWSGLTWVFGALCADAARVTRETKQICSDERTNVPSIREVYSGGVEGIQPPQKDRKRTQYPEARRKLWIRCDESRAITSEETLGSFNRRRRNPIDFVMSEPFRGVFILTQMAEKDQPSFIGVDLKPKDLI